MAELVDALGLGSSGVSREGSSPFSDIDTAGNIRWYQLSGQIDLKLNPYKCGLGSIQAQTDSIIYRIKPLLISNQRHEKLEVVSLKTTSYRSRYIVVASTCGVSSAVERYPSKLDVVGSIPILRSYP